MNQGTINQIILHYNLFKSIHTDPTFAEYMEEIFNRVEVMKRSADHKEGQIKCRIIHSQVFEDSDLHVFHKLGTSSGAGYILSHVEGDLGSRWEIFSKKWCLTRWWYMVARHEKASWVIRYIKMEVKSCFYVIDIVKDIQLIWILATKIPSQAAILYGASITSLTVSELTKALHNATCRQDASVVKRIGHFITSPIARLYINQQQFALESRMLKFALALDKTPSSTEYNENQLTAARRELQQNTAIWGELRSLENVLENSLHIILPLLAIDLESWGLTDSDLLFLRLSCGLSLASLLFGQTSALASRKNGQLGLKAMVFIFVYLFTAVLPRGYLVFCSLRVILRNYGIISFIPLLTALLVMLLHTIISMVIQTKVFMARRNRVIEALCTLLAPPLTMDWDRLYQERKLPFDECWARAKKVVLLHNLLTFFGNMAIGAALLLCQDFEHTEIILIIVPTILNPILLLGMGYLYFRSVHPWRILHTQEGFLVSKQTTHNSHDFHTDDNFDTCID